jgi:DNA-binding transcriptional regulator YbjK
MQSLETLQERRTAATRNHILDAAFDLLTRNPEQPLSHESVAAEALKAKS